MQRRSDGFERLDRSHLAALHGTEYGPAAKLRPVVLPNGLEKLDNWRAIVSGYESPKDQESEKEGEADPQLESSVPFGWAHREAIEVGVGLRSITE